MRMFIILVLAISCLNPVANSIGRKEPEGKEQEEQSTEMQNELPPFLPEGTIINKRTRDKIYCFLIRNTEIQGLLCRGDTHEGWETVFYTNGKLALAWLAQEEEVQGVPCAPANFWTELFGGSAAVRFYDNGKLAKCKLARDVTIEGHFFKKGDHIRFDREGRLMSAR